MEYGHGKQLLLLLYIGEHFIFRTCMYIWIWKKKQQIPNGCIYWMFATRPRPENYFYWILLDATVCSITKSHCIALHFCLCLFLVQYLSVFLCALNWLNDVCTFPTGHIYNGKGEWERDTSNGSWSFTFRVMFRTNLNMCLIFVLHSFEYRIVFSAYFCFISHCMLICLDSLKWFSYAFQCMILLWLLGVCVYAFFSLVSFALSVFQHHL